jgi:hypothetical protein
LCVLVLLAACSAIQQITYLRNLDFIVSALYPKSLMEMFGSKPGTRTEVNLPASFPIQLCTVLGGPSHAYV